MYRFIPARAGNRYVIARSLFATTVYPRSRGEQDIEKTKSPSPIGLSPLARGTGVKV